MKNTHQHQNHSNLEVCHSHHLKYEGEEGIYHILGSLPMDISSLRISLHIQRPEQRKQRLKIDLYDYAQIQQHCIHLSEQEDFDFSKLESDLLSLTELLEKHREAIFKADYNQDQPKTKKHLSLEKEKEVVALLNQPDLLEIIKTKLTSIGIAGEVDNRLLLFILGTSYKGRTHYMLLFSLAQEVENHT